MEDIELAAIVIDNGTGLIKSGLAGEIAPRKSFPSLYGSTRFQGLDIALDQCDYAVGDEAFAKRGVMNMCEPIKKGVIVDWDIMEKVWHHTFYNELKVDPQEHPALITDCPQNKPENKEKAAQIFFENFNVPSFYIGNQAVLALLASGSTKGIVFDSGEGCTHVVPIYEAYALPHSTAALDICGRDLTNHMMNLLIKEGLTFSRHYDIDIIKKIKETKTKVSRDYAKDEQEFLEGGNSNDVIFELPDGKTINIGKPQIECPEALFNPSLIGKDIVGIHELIYRSYFTIDMEVKKTLFSKIVLAGGNTMFPSIAERLCKEMKNLGHNSVPFTVHVPAERQYTGWIGGSVLSSLSTFHTMWISKKEYEEEGEGVVKRKCL